MSKQLFVQIPDSRIIWPPEHLPESSMVFAQSLMVASMKGSVTGPAAREPFDKLMEKVPAAHGVSFEKAEVDGVPGRWCRLDNAPTDAAILYFHGGAYVAGSALAYQHFVGQVAARAKVAAFVPEYGFAPEHPIPAAVNHAQAAYKGLVVQGFERIALAGDSAGGGLALVLLSLEVAKALDDIGDFLGAQLVGEAKHKQDRFQSANMPA